MLRAVTNVRNADASLRARIHFAEDPENPYLQELIGKSPCTAVTWDIQGLTPNGRYKLEFQSIHLPRQSLTGREFFNVSLTNLTTRNRKNLLAMDYNVICGGESGWEYAKEKVKENPVIVANAEGRAQGVSIERGLLVKDVLGKMIVMQEIRDPSVENEPITNLNRKRRTPALGIIGCQCMK